MAQSFVIDLVPSGPQLANDIADLKHIPGHDGVVQNRQATGRMHLVAEALAFGVQFTLSHCYHGKKFLLYELLIASWTISVLMSVFVQVAPSFAIEG